MENLSKLFQALSDKNRLIIIGLLYHRELCVCEISHILNLAPSTVSRHLKILKNVDIIIDKKIGKWVNYSLSNRMDDTISAVILPLIISRLRSSSDFAGYLKNLEKIDRFVICQSN